MANCLTRALDQWWESSDEFRLYYNSNHVISLEKGIKPPEGYDPIEDYGYFYFLNSFNPTPQYIDLLEEYLSAINRAIAK